MATPPPLASAASPAGKRVVVCGGSVIGACTAYFLAHKGAAHVTVVEKSSIACAASGKAAGFLALDWCDGTPLASTSIAPSPISSTAPDPTATVLSLSLSLLPGGAASAAASRLVRWPDRSAQDDRASIRMLHKIAGDVSSHLRDEEAEVKAEQACFLPCSEDGLPVIGEIPGVSGCYVATGHSCWGWPGYWSFTGRAHPARRINHCGSEALQPLAIPQEAQQGSIASR